MWWRNQSFHTRRMKLSTKNEVRRWGKNNMVTIMNNMSLFVGSGFARELRMPGPLRFSNQCNIEYKIDCYSVLILNFLMLLISEKVGGEFAWHLGSEFRQLPALIETPASYCSKTFTWVFITKLFLFINCCRQTAVIYQLTILQDILMTC